MHAQRNCKFNQANGRKLCNLKTLDISTLKRLQLDTLLRKRGVCYSLNAMEAAGFTYAGDGDTFQCTTCNLIISGWTKDMNPFLVHAEHNPNCSFVLSIKSSSSMFSVPQSQSKSIHVTLSTAQSDNNEYRSKRQKTDNIAENRKADRLVEINSLQQIRQRSFSHWPHRTSPSHHHMIQAGFFYCNVGDRVICLYCNLICQQWIPYEDDPCEVHKTLRPRCPFVISMLIHHEAPPILVFDESRNETCSTAIGTSALNRLRKNEIAPASAYHTAYIEIPKRYASFAKWPTDPLPSVDDFVRSGFFYTGMKTIVTCFYCNGSLQNWGPDDDPTIEHARWFPYCAYAKQLCGDKLYRKIQESKRMQSGNLFIAGKTFCFNELCVFISEF